MATASTPDHVLKRIRRRRSPLRAAPPARTRRRPRSPCASARRRWPPAAARPPAAPRARRASPSSDVEDGQGRYESQREHERAPRVRQGPPRRVRVQANSSLPPRQCGRGGLGPRSQRSPAGAGGQPVAAHARRHEHLRGGCLGGGSGSGRPGAPRCRPGGGGRRGSRASCSPTPIRTTPRAPTRSACRSRCRGEGEEVGPFTALATPGHSPDSVCLVAGRICFTGDTVLGTGSVFIAPGEGSLAAYLRSLERLREPRPRGALPGPRPVRVGSAGEARRVHRAPPGPRAPAPRGPRGRRAARPATCSTPPGRMRRHTCARRRRCRSRRTWRSSRDEGRLPAGVETRPQATAGSDARGARPPRRSRASTPATSTAARAPGSAPPRRSPWRWRAAGPP